MAEVERKEITPGITFCKKYCKYCDICVKVCPTDNLSFDKDKMVFSNGPCSMCGLCMKFCPDFAIEVTK